MHERVFFTPSFILSPADRNRKRGDAFWDTELLTEVYRRGKEYSIYSEKAGPLLTLPSPWITNLNYLPQPPPNSD